MHKHMQLFSTDSGAYWVSKLVRAYFNEWGDKHDRVEPFHCNFQTGPPGIAQMSRWPVRHGTDSTRKIYATSLSHIIYANCSCQNLLHPPLYLPHSFLFSLTFPIAYIIPSICFCSPFHCPELPQPIFHREVLTHFPGSLSRRIGTNSNVFALVSASEDLPLLSSHISNKLNSWWQRRMFVNKLYWGVESTTTWSKCFTNRPPRQAVWC